MNIRMVYNKFNTTSPTTVISMKIVHLLQLAQIKNALNSMEKTERFLLEQLDR